MLPVEIEAPLPAPEPSAPSREASAPPPPGLRRRLATTCVVAASAILLLAAAAVVMRSSVAGLETFLPRGAAAADARQPFAKRRRIDETLRLPSEDVWSWGASALRSWMPHRAQDEAPSAAAPPPAERRRRHYLEWQEDDSQRPTCGPAQCGGNGARYASCTTVGKAYVPGPGGPLVEAPPGSTDFMCLEVCQSFSEELVTRSAKGGECEAVARRYDEDPGHEYCRFFDDAKPEEVQKYNAFLGLEVDCLSLEGREAAELLARSRSQSLVV